MDEEGVAAAVRRVDETRKKCGSLGVRDEFLVRDILDAYLDAIVLGTDVGPTPSADEPPAQRDIRPEEAT